MAALVVERGSGWRGVAIVTIAGDRGRRRGSRDGDGGGGGDSDVAMAVVEVA